MTHPTLWSATRWPRGAGAAFRRRLSQTPPWRKQALLAALVLLLLVGLAASGTLVMRGGALLAFGIGSRPTPSDTTGTPVSTGTAATTTSGQSAATTTITITLTTTATVARSTATVIVITTATARASATAGATTTATTTTATATATPLPPTATPLPPTLTLDPLNLELKPVQTKCSATQTIKNNTSQTVGWTWQPPTQGGMSFQVNKQAPVGWPKDTTPGIAPGGLDTLVATSDCKPSPYSFAVLMTTTLNDKYTFSVTID